MTDKKKLIIVAVVLVAVLLGAAALYRSLSSGEPTAAQSTPEPAEDSAVSPSAAPEEESATLAPDFTMLDAEGNTVSLSDYLGGPVVLNFWASWCGPCKSEMPTFDVVAAELEGEVSFLMVNLTDGSRETVEGVAQFVADRGFEFPVFYDTEGSGATAYAVRSIPVTYFIDAEGYLRAYSAGSMSEKTLREGLAMIAPTPPASGA